MTVDVRTAVLGRKRLHEAITDPQMDSMRILSETAMRFPQALSFSSGAPYDGHYDPAELQRQFRRYLAHLRERSLSERAVNRLIHQYGPVNGFIRDEVATMLANDEQITAAPEAIMITNGCQEAMLIVLRGLCASPDDMLLAVSPTYVGILGAARMLDVPLHGIADGPDGLDPQAVAEAARAVRAQGRRPVAVYLVPSFSNPTGTVVPLEARHELLRVAAGEDLYILEDNPYGVFARADEYLPTLKSLDTERRVIYLGSFAKSAFPGARLGYLVADQVVTGAGEPDRTLAEELSKAKAMFSVGSSSLSQAVIGGYLVDHGFRLRGVTDELAVIYLERLDAALAALAEHFPPEEYDQHGVRWNTPQGGFFVAVEVGFTADLAALERSARDYGVSWAPMSMFYVGPGDDRVIRLGISNLAPNDIRAGIARFARFVADTTEKERS
jgi:(S)-3,5-dihydroxyphenylglycine transaminase